jgi:DNA polymerase I-like protein with 3'-5' exonuclease and polymerase domains
MTVPAILVDLRNWDEVSPLLFEKMSRATFIGFDIEGHDNDRHEGLNRFMKVDPEGYSHNQKLVFDIRRTVVTGFSLYFDGDDTSYYVNLEHADVENRLPWEIVRPLLDAKPTDAWWIAHNAPFELTMMWATSLGFDLGQNVICTMQLAVSSYNEDEYPLTAFNAVTFGDMAQFFPIIAREFAMISPDKKLTPTQEELLYKVIGKSSKASFSYNGFVKSLSYGYGLKKAVKSWFGYDMTTFEQALNGKPHMGALTGDEVAAYGADDAYWAVRLFHRLLEHNALNNPQVTTTYFTQELPMIHVYAEVWRTGLRVNFPAIAKRRDQERISYAQTVREMKVLVRELLPFPEEPNESLLKREKWYQNGKHLGYRRKIETFAKSKDYDDDFKAACQLAGAVPNAWAEDRGEAKPSSVNINHYMAMRTLLHDLCGLSTVISGGKVSTDAASRLKLVERATKAEKTTAVAIIQLLNTMASIDQRMKLYLTPYGMLVDPETERLYPVLSSMLNSRRMATRFPNPMQLAKRGESTYVRGFYLADEDDHVIVSIDWSQVELVEIGDFSKDPAFAEAYGQIPFKDLHWKAVGDMFETDDPKSLPDAKNLRTKVGKGANFNYWYSGALSNVGEAMGWSSEKMWEMTDKYRTTFAVAEEWRTNLIGEARLEGFVTLPDGHRRVKHDASYQWQTIMRNRFSALSSVGLSAFGELFIKKITARAGNQIVNSVVQGSCSTLAKRSILRINAWLRESGIRARFMLPVHDELVFSVHREDVTVFIREARRIMCAHPDIITTLMLDASASVGLTFEPWHPDKAPTGQIELDEAPVIEGVLGIELKDSRLGDEHIKAVVRHLFETRSKLAQVLETVS